MNVKQTGLTGVNRVQSDEGSTECSFGRGKEIPGSTIHWTAPRMRVGKNDFSPWVYLVLSKTKLQNTQDSICAESKSEPHYILPSEMALSVSHWHFQNLTTGLCLSRREEQAYTTLAFNKITWYSETYETVWSKTWTTHFGDKSCYFLWREAAYSGRYLSLLRSDILFPSSGIFRTYMWCCMWTVLQQEVESRGITVKSIGLIKLFHKFNQEKVPKFGGESS